MDVVDCILREAKLVSRNAESDIYIGEYLGRQVVVKKRIPKKYRVEALDSKLRMLRTYREANIMYLSSINNVPVPKLLYSSLKSTSLVIEYIKGVTLDKIIKKDGYEDVYEYIVEMGGIISKLHSLNVVHGDPHPANFIVAKNTLWVIDFGLSFFSDSIKEFVYDLNVTYRSFLSLNPNLHSKYFRAFLEGYRKFYNRSEDVIELHNKVIKIGRYHERNR